MIEKFFRSAPGFVGLPPYSSDGSKKKKFLTDPAFSAAASYPIHTSATQNLIF
ncbi:hypothetical protein [Pseudoflavonifractor capillosus]|uniref:Uncharacterized protein n=1 Tax=Pseudoflavonifractor capillosus TaxID=106588 RepID=A0A921MK92_9FIRM|nr:hypothetical protein [Pseudoflavonifractor capillosus]HJG85800.1 hypothetical protein [Pseudoflavonifractor capillosus]